MNVHKLYAIHYEWTHTHAHTVTNTHLSIYTHIFILIMRDFNEVSEENNMHNRHS
jgi:hypothetical protein